MSLGSLSPEAHQTITAAMNMLGGEIPYEEPPVFWTIQFMKRLDYIGHAEDWDETVMHGAPQDLDCLIYYVKHGLVAAAAGIGRDRDTAALSELFRRRHDWTVEELGNAPAELLQA